MNFTNCEPTATIAMINYKFKYHISEHCCLTFPRKANNFIFLLGVCTFWGVEHMQIFKTISCHCSLHSWSRIKITSQASDTQETCFIWIISEFKLRWKQMFDSVFSLHFIFICMQSIFKSRLACQSEWQKKESHFILNNKENSKAGNILSLITWTSTCTQCFHVLAEPNKLMQSFHFRFWHNVMIISLYPSHHFTCNFVMINFKMISRSGVSCCMFTRLLL